MARMVERLGSVFYSGRQVARVETVAARSERALLSSLAPLQAFFTGHSEKRESSKLEFSCEMQNRGQ
jgi:hypothetical protein